MKITAAAAILVTCVPSLALALVGNEWKFTKAPEAGLADITFPFNMAKAPHKSGFYFAQQFNFHGIKDVGYTGLQPREDENGKSVVHAAFSSFQAGATTKHRNCHTGADGGPGVSCAIDIKDDYSNTYNITVENIRDTTWRGTLINTVTKKADVIGEWTLPKGAGKIVNGQLGFVEYYTWNGQPSHTCDSLPYTQAVFYDPTSKTKGAEGGKITKVYEYGDCVGKAGYVVKKGTNNYDIKVGF
ncbi:hypothetical protein BGZ96_011027 [Linnemannia gamsii]|uniref:Uncharacterized protein n=1 Tax=Linnemannia gamsii TaxID=64522 RepID=A0ABQ7JT30_9FUNG|nr:hypothetical protein BGZ96_011027 [Linnemannia gamsii]